MMKIRKMGVKEEILKLLGPVIVKGMLVIDSGDCSGSGGKLVVMMLVDDSVS